MPEKGSDGAIRQDVRAQGGRFCAVSVQAFVISLLMDTVTFVVSDVAELGSRILPDEML